MSTLSFVPTPAPQALSPIPDPALTAQTFLRNSRLAAALARLQTQHAQHPAPVATAKPDVMPGINTGAESDGSDASFRQPETNNRPSLERAFLYLVTFRTADDCLTEGYRVRATDFTTAIENATQQAAPKHPLTTLRVASAREVDEQR